MDERLHCSTKLDRDPAFIADLMAKGQNRGAAFLDGQ
jgi:hypothetical protein